MATAVAEERAQPELGDEGHDWPAAEDLGRSADGFSLARDLAAASDPIERAVAAHALGAMTDGNSAQAAEAVAVLSGMLRDAGDLHLEWSIADALRLCSDEAAVEPLAALAGSSSASVRRTVAMGLELAMSEDLRPAGLAALIRLSADPDGSVRDWATFALAELDSSLPQVREALWARVEDPHYNTRSEALAGLAASGDREVVDRVRAELESDYVGRLIVQAAVDLGDRRLLGALQALRGWWDVDLPLLERAIQASS
ncbi:MAG: HEAT repeat domain-containing protein [Candidatus Dormibacteraeota bacterium]|nr:HEAT repeat domain-containing protein [Candidatus Dormibacteraeota bacterium]